MLCWNTLFGHATPQQQEDSYFLLTFKTSVRGKDWHQRFMSNIDWCLLFNPNVHQPTQQKPNLSTKSYKIQIFFKSIFLNSRLRTAWWFLVRSYPTDTMLHSGANVIKTFSPVWKNKLECFFLPWFYSLVWYLRVRLLK